MNKREVGAVRGTLRIRGTHDKLVAFLGDIFQAYAYNDSTAFVVKDLVDKGDKTYFVVTTNNPYGSLIYKNDAHEPIYSGRSTVSGYILKEGPTTLVLPITWYEKYLWDVGYLKEIAKKYGIMIKAWGWSESYKSEHIFVVDELGEAVSDALNKYEDWEWQSPFTTV